MIEESIKVYKNLAEARMKDCEEYKKRINKEIEYIIKNSEMYDEDLCTDVGFELKDLLNILQGEDKDDK